MFRASRSFLRVAHRASLAGSTAHKLPQLQLQASKLLPITQRARFASKSDDPPPPKPQIDVKHEKELADKKLKADPSKVSSTSSVAHAGLDFGPSSPTVPSGQPDDTPDIQSGLKHDLNIVRDTFRLDSVPRESYLLGLAGTLPYLGTSLSTMFLAWDLSKDIPSGNSFYDAVLIDHETAQHLLTLIEPVQLGYGAVIISFLGAIHWGLEYAEKTPHPERTRFRYGMGLASSIIAWPTLFMPLEYALTTQFMAFIALYFADARAAARGWAPYWYGTYRFLLTAMVGVAIFVSLVGRSKINQNDRVDDSSVTKAGIADHRTNWAKLEAEEKEKLRKEREEQAEKQAEEEAKEKKEAKKSKGKKKGKQDSKAADEGDEDDGDDGEKGEEKKEKKPKKKESGKSDDADDSEDKDEDEESDDEDEGDDKESKDSKDEDEEGDDDEEKEGEQKDEKKNDKKDDKKSKKDDKKKAEKKEDDNKDESADSDEKEEKKDDDSEGDDTEDKEDKDSEQDEESKDDKKDDKKKGDKKDDKKDQKEGEDKDSGGNTNEDKDEEKTDDKKDEGKDKKKDKKKK